MKPIQTHLTATLDIDMWEYFGHEFDHEEMAYRVDTLTETLSKVNCLPLALGIDGDRHVFLTFRRTLDLVDVRMALSAALVGMSGSLNKYNAWRLAHGLEPASSFTPPEVEPPDFTGLDWLNEEKGDFE